MERWDQLTSQPGSVNQSNWNLVSLTDGSQGMTSGNFPGSHAGTPKIGDGLTSQPGATTSGDSVSPPSGATTNGDSLSPPSVPPEPEFPTTGVHRGSYYHKVVSDYGTWNGIDTVVTLGTPHNDSKRKTKQGNYRDDFSTYLGGRPKDGIELDAGLTWDVTLDKHGKPDPSHHAWRPFWRNGKWNNAPAEAKFYWKPGDTVDMSLHMVAPGKMQMTISDIGPNPKHSFTTEFTAPGFKDGKQITFKHVDSIDQAGNEGRPVVPTHASLTGIKWQSADLLTDANGGSISFSPDHQKVINDPTGHVRSSSDTALSAAGGENVEIDGTARKK